MTARHETSKPDVWQQLAALIPPARIGWRQDGKASQRQGKYYARFVAFIDAQFVRERLDEILPGEWDVTLDPLPPLTDSAGKPVVSVKARIQILGVIREDIGQGRDWKAAASDAFKRAAVRFGIGHELYDFKQNWVQVDSDSNFAKPLEDPAEVYAKQHGGPKTGAKVLPPSIGDATETFDREVRVQDDPVPVAQASDPESTSCPKCGGKTWDNRVGKRNPKAPDFKCRDKGCDGVIWPPKGAGADVAKSKAKPGREVGTSADRPLVTDSDTMPDDVLDEVIANEAADTDDLPF